MTHDGSKDSSVGVVVQYLENISKEYQFEYIKKDETNAVRKQGIVGNFISFFIKKPFHLATAAYVLQDNIFLPMAYLHFPKAVKIIQLWHGTGTIKKFGQSVNTGRLGKLEKRANQTITHLLVNSEYTKKQYKEAFGVSEDKIKVLGLPRTDIMFQEDKKARDLEEFYHRFPDLKEKKLVLYAPTFRDNEVNNPKIMLDVNLFIEQTPEEYVLILKLHPFVAAAFQLDTKQYQGRVMNLSTYGDLNTLLFAADILVTDYSSIIFEYCLLDKPMIFYAYDLDQFSDMGRGFYESYEDYVPGPVVKNTLELSSIIRSNCYDLLKIRQFRVKSYEYLDGQSTKRLVEKIIL